MAPVFDQVIAAILGTMNQEDDYTNEEKKKDPRGFSLDSDSEDDLDGVNVDMNSVDEKSAAVNALGIIAIHAPKLFANKRKEIFESMEKLHHYFHENVKFHVSKAYNDIVLGMMRINGLLNVDEKYEWTKGAPSACPLPVDVMQMLNQIMFPYLFSLFDEEDNKEVIERALSNLTELSIDFGPGVFNDSMEKVTQYIIKFLQKKTFCQTGNIDDEDGEDFKDENPEDDDDDEESEEGDDGIDHDELILGNTTDLVFELARAFGNEFAPYFTMIAPHLVEYTTDKHPKSDKNMAIGCLSEVFAGAPGIIPTYFNDYLQLLEKNSNTTDCKINRNVSYSIGILAQHSQVLFQPHVNSGIALLGKLHQNSTEPDTKDNIVAATCRILEFQYMPLPASQRPADFDGIMDSVFSKIPFEGDVTENETILQFAFNMYNTTDQPIVLKYMPQIATTCIKVICDEKTSDSIQLKFRKTVGEFIKGAVMQHAQGLLQECEAKMTQDEKEELAKFVA